MQQGASSQVRRLRLEKHFPAAFGKKPCAEERGIRMHSEHFHRRQENLGKILECGRVGNMRAADNLKLGHFARVRKHRKRGLKQQRARARGAYVELVIAAIDCPGLERKRCGAKRRALHLRARYFCEKIAHCKMLCGKPYLWPASPNIDYADGRMQHAGNRKRGAQQLPPALAHGAVDFNHGVMATGRNKTQGYGQDSLRQRASAPRERGRAKAAATAEKSGKAARGGGAG